MRWLLLALLIATSSPAAEEPKGNGSSGVGSARTSPIQLGYGLSIDVPKDYGIEVKGDRVIDRANGQVLLEMRLINPDDPAFVRDQLKMSQLGSARALEYQPRSAETQEQNRWYIPVDGKLLELRVATSSNPKTGGVLGALVDKNNRRFKLEINYQVKRRGGIPRRTATNGK